jgi:tRNA (guanine10-N2)-dimethyltransferase
MHGDSNVFCQKRQSARPGAEAAMWYIHAMKFFVLGNNRELSVAEIESVTGAHEFASREGDVLLLEANLPGRALQDRLAGTIKVGSVVGEIAEWDRDACADLVAAMVDAELPRVEFGISVHDAGNARRAKELRAESEKLGLAVKKRLKESGRPVRLVTSREKTLSAVVITTNRLLERGGEFVLIATADNILIGQTEAVQDFEAWGERDFGRPARDAQSGMLPPKLARMMVNLSGAEPHASVLLDPFCGSGTVLMEAALLGFKSVVGSDISAKAIADTRANIDWLAKKYDAVLPVTLLVSPAQTLRLDAPVDVVVTETYLGPALHGREHPEFLKRNLAALSTLYREAFGALAELVKPGGAAVVAFPVFQSKGDETEVATRTMMESLGWKVERRLRYERAGQHVEREIFVMKKT